jgi:hypothetical protein
MIKKIKYLILLLALSACDKHNYTWEVYDSKVTNLKSNDEDFGKILIIDNSLYLFGNNSESLNLRDMKYVVYKSTNFGKKWREVLGGTGNIVNEFYANQNIYVAKENYSQNLYKDFTTTLFKFNIKSEIIKDVHQFKKNVSITDGILNDNGSGALIVSNSFSSIDYSILKTKNNFISSDSISINKPIVKSCFNNSDIYFLSNNNNNSNELIYKIKKDNRLDSLTVNFDVTDFIVEKDQSIFLLGNNESAIQLRKIHGKRNILLYTFIKDKEYFPKSIYKYNKFIAVIISKLNSLGTTNQLFLSFDDGKSFKNEELPIADYLGPIAFYKDEKIIIYSGAGRISYCNLKK